MYKYTQKFVSDLLFLENTIRVGTLYGFRDMEAKQGISDPKEGEYEDTLHLDYFHMEEEDAHNPLLQHNLPGIMIQNSRDIKIINTRKSVNYIIYCTAHTKSKEIMNQFEGADTCIEIYKKQTFYQLMTWALAKELKTQVKFLGVHPVNYDHYNRVRYNPYEYSLHPVLAKTKEFEPQCELRAIWEVPDDSLISKSFYDLSVTGLRKCCKLIEI